MFPGVGLGGGEMGDRVRDSKVRATLVIVHSTIGDGPSMVPYW